MSNDFRRLRNSLALRGLLPISAPAQAASRLRGHSCTFIVDDPYEVRPAPKPLQLLDWCMPRGATGRWRRVTLPMARRLLNFDDLLNTRHHVDIDRPVIEILPAEGPWNRW